MNFLAHGFRSLDDPAQLIGTALPDLIRVAQRRARISAENATAAAAGADRDVAQVAAGVLLHERDDRRFHSSEAFTRLLQRTTLDWRQRWTKEPRFRPSVAAHIAIEMLLDASIEERTPGTISRYYAAWRTCHPARVEEWVERLRDVPCPGLSDVIRRFVATGFLADYDTDRGVTSRLDRVLGRVGLPRLPEGFGAAVGELRPRVRDEMDALLRE